MTSATRPRNSAATQALIKAAARDRFAADGYQKTTIRAVAADAGVDPALVMRYFGNKDGLFAAAADFDLRLPDLSGADVDTIGRRLAEHFLDRWEGDETFTALLHAAVGYPAARDRLYQVIFTSELSALAARVAPDPDSATARVGLVASQILGTALCRYVLGLPPVADMPRAELITWLGDTLQRYLTAPAEATGGGRS
ncbi:TetR family transcriptional regulator [Microlunatus sp. GCM10028923]|uniref:TetR/AcrR family transcriptional regulator n=1 Tax=Microlunatus sp. GCM10028923 TaxID=3273400 RepID=UPI003616ACF2